MTVSESVWKAYIRKLSAINKTAARKFEAFLNTHDYSTAEGRKLIIDCAYALVEQYGEASAALSCEMYDAIRIASGVVRAAAEPAAVASYGEVAKTVNGMIKQSNNVSFIASGVERLVKQTGADTTLKNAIRDGAEWAWVPSGDTCSFCITLASRGWQKASRKQLDGNHAEHIHANCNCQFAIRFGESTKYAGYDPDKYLEMYENAYGRSSKDKINSMRRDYYEEHKAEIREQQNEAYYERKEAEEGGE